MRVASRFRYSLAAVICAGSGLFSVTATAQQANPAQLAPRLQPAPTPGIGIGPAPVEVIKAPPNAEKIFVTVRRVDVNGAFAELEGETATLIAQIQGQHVSVAKIYDLARAIEATYTARYPLARVKVPPQDFGSGVVRIDIIDGFIERVDVDEVPERAKAPVLWRLEPLIGRRHLTREEIQRRILLLGDIAGVVGSTSGKFGSTPDGNVLIIKATEKLLTGASVIDNRLSKYLGTWEFTDSAAVNNAFGFGEQFYATVASSSDFERFFDGRSKFQAWGGGVSLPIGYDGLKAEAGYLSVRQRPTPLDGVFPLEQLVFDQRTAGRFERAYASVIYPLILTTDQTLRVQGTFDFIEERLRQGPAPLGFASPVGWVYDYYRDRYSAVRLAAEWGVQFPWDWGGRAVSTAIYSHGLGGRTAWDAPFVGSSLSRNGAGPVFDRLYVDTRVIQPLPDQFEALLVARAQTSFGQSLMLAEQFSLDGPSAVSGFASGTVNVDRGITLRSELSRSFNVDFGFVQGNISPYIFGAWGRGVREWPFFGVAPFWGLGEVKWVEAESFGVGLRTGAVIDGLPLAEGLNVEFAKSISNLPFRRSGYRTNLTFILKF